MLPEGEVLYLEDKVLNLGDKYLLVNTNTAVRGKTGTELILSTTTGAVIRSDAESSDDPFNAIQFKEFNVIAPMGTCFSMRGDNKMQLNFFYVGMAGNTAAKIDGFDVAAFKSCFIKAKTGLKFSGITNKIFIDGTPFYDTEQTAILFDYTSRVRVIDIGTCFFKSDLGICIDALPGAELIKEGTIHGCLIDGLSKPLGNGLHPAMPKWVMTNNSGIRDSNIIAEFHSIPDATFKQEPDKKPKKLDILTISGEANEKFKQDGLGVATYIGTRAATVIVLANISFHNNSSLPENLYVALNDKLLKASTSSSVSAILDAVQLNPGDQLSIYIKNTKKPVYIKEVTLIAKG